MPKGRPIKTEIREKISSILQQTNIAYGYQIYKIYKEIFGVVSLRNLYYNLKKGVDLGEFIVVEIKKDTGSYTWGGEVEHKYYALGPYALFHKQTDTQKTKISNLKSEIVQIDWVPKIETILKRLSEKVKTFHSIKVRLKYEDKRKLENKLKAETEYLKGWIKQKVGKSEEFETKLVLIQAEITPHTP